ncbi:MAG: PKD domain-containing protein, partial [Phycisphaerae bacterium]
MNRRITIVTALCALAAASGMTTQGCRGIDVPGLGPNPPAIVVEDVVVATLTRTLSVDLRKFPQARRVTWAFGDGIVIVDLPVADGRTVVHTFDEDGTFVVEVHLFTGVDPLTRERSLLATGRLPIDVIGP